MNFKHTVLLSMTILSLAIAGCSKKEPAAQTTQEQIVPVQVEKTVLGTVQDKASIIGKLSPDETVDVSPKVSGKISEIKVSLGQQVNQGDILFVLDQQDLANTVKQSQAAYQLALASLKQADSSAVQSIEQAEHNVIQYQNSISKAENALVQQHQFLIDAQNEEQRITQLHQAGAVADTELERAQTALKNAQLAFQNAQTALSDAKASHANALKILEHAKNKNALQVSQASVHQAQVNLENAKDQLANAVVKAPLSGIISLVKGSAGQMVSQQMPVISIAKIDPLLVKAHLSEQEITTVKVGSPVSIEIPAAQKNLEAKVTAVSPVMDPNLKAYPIEISISNQGQQLKADMVSHLRFISEQGEEKKIVVPRTSVIEEQGKRYVYVVEAESAKKIEIETGKETSDQVEVLKGLTIGEQIVVKGQTLLKDGVKVKVQKN